MVALPAPTIVTCPVEELTVATDVLPELYVTVPSPVFVNSFVKEAFPNVLLTDVFA